MKYIIMVIWSSGDVESIVCETMNSAEICIKSLRKQSNINFIGLFEFGKRKSELN